MMREGETGREKIGRQEMPRGQERGKLWERIAQMFMLVVIATILSSSLLCLKSTFSFHILRINHLDLETFGNLNS